MRVTRSTQAQDRNGVDYWVRLYNENKLGVDVKIRRNDWAKRGHDDLALETFSVREKWIEGWSRNPDKRCDYILWLWQDTGRWCLIPFPMLCAVMRETWLEWLCTFKFARQQTTDRSMPYTSECVFVPRRVVWAAIYRRFGGAPPVSESKVVPSSDGQVE